MDKNFIEINFDSIPGISEAIRRADNHLENAKMQLRESTDLGSSIMQKIWQFSSKEKIFADISETIKKIDRIMQADEALVRTINSIPAEFNNVSMKNRTELAVSRMHIIEAITMPLISPVIASFVFSWNAYKYFSVLNTNYSDKNKKLLNIDLGMIISPAPHIMYRKR